MIAELRSDVKSDEEGALTSVANPTVHNIIDELVEELINMNLEYTNHNSNYNKKKSWQALSLMGFEKDSTYVDKKADLKEDRPIVKTDLYDKLESKIDHFLNQ